MNGELFRLAVQGIGRKKRSSLLLFAVLMLSFAFAVISLTVTSSMQKTNREYLYDTYGVWYGAIPDGLYSDEAYLLEQPWLGELGICTSYGEISAISGGSQSIGTADKTFLKIGRISLQDGRFPENENEIAMEADLLSALGYDYTIGQEITLTVEVPASLNVEEISETATWSPNELPRISSVSVETTFTLCGVLREYSDLWSRGSGTTTYNNTSPLNSALITQEAAESVSRSAKEEAKKLRELMNERYEGGLFSVSLVNPHPQYYFTVSDMGAYEESVSDLRAAIRANTFNADGNLSRIRSVCTNLAAYNGVEQDITYSTFYTGIILAVTLLSIICIYAIRLQDEARQLATFRSIGITKRQLCLMLIYETLCLAVPAMILGTAAGALGTWAILRLAVYSGSATVAVDIPPVMLIIAVAIWLLGVILARLAVFLVALRSPLTGRFHIARKSARKHRLFRRAVIIVLTVMFCATVIFTCLESFDPIYGIKMSHAFFDYRIVSNEADDLLMVLRGNTEVLDLWSIMTLDNLPEEKTYPNRDSTFPESSVRGMENIAGVKSVWGAGSHIVRLDFDGMYDLPLIISYLQDRVVRAREIYEARKKQAGEDADLEEYDEENIPIELAVGIGPYDVNALEASLISVDWGDWEGTIDFSCIDKDKFISGDEVMICFMTDSSGKLMDIFGAGGYSIDDAGISVGDKISITVGLPQSYGVTETVVGGISVLSQSYFSFQSPYNIVCSGAFVEKLLNSLPEGSAWNDYRQGTPYGYQRAYIHTGFDAEYLSTDAVIAQMCAKEGLYFDNRREKNRAELQEHIQQLILLLSGGGCIALVLMLIFGNTVSFEAEHEKKNYGVLQALGMSRRQMRRRQVGTALIRGAAGAFAGWAAYGGYCVVYAIQEKKRFLLEFEMETTVMSRLKSKLSLLTQYYGNLQTYLLLTAAVIILVLAISLIAKRRLFRGDLMAKLRDER